MTVYRAAWVCPISRPPVPGGWVAVSDGRIVSTGGAHEAPPAAPRDLGRVAILPALVNAHTHLELSWLRGRVPPAASFVDWIKQLFITRGGRHERLDDERVARAAHDAAREIREYGTIAVGDISNSLASVAALRAHGLSGIVFHELLGFNLVTGARVEETRALRASAAALGGDAVRIGVAPHAPYSVSPEMFRAIRAEVDASAVRITSVHLGESAAEVDFLRDGSGPWPGLLRLVGSERADWTPPGTTPVQYLASLGALDARTLVVHAVQLDAADLARLAAIGCTVVTCPRSNQWVGVGVPPVKRFYDAGCRVAVGTDSLASVEDLNLFAELKTLRWLAPEVPAAALLESATRIGAEALGLGSELGTIDAGKRAALIAVDLASGLASSPAAASAPVSQGREVEEFLVGGVGGEQVRWLAA